jgi:hypothetical protein
VGEIRNTYKILDVKPERKKPLRRPDQDVCGLRVANGF